MRDLSTHLNCVSFFTGGGGLELGLKRVLGERLRCIAYVEREAYGVANLLSKIEEGSLCAAPIFTDVTTFPAEKFRGLVDLFCGGYPCQPESVAGQQLGTEDPRFLWPYCRSFVAAVRPVLCFFENVRGHVNQSMVEVLRDLAELQYAVEPGIFSAEECGGTHSRERVFILARDVANPCDSRPWNIGGPLGRQHEPAQLRQGNGEIGTDRLAATGENVGHAERFGLHGYDRRGPGTQSADGCVSLAHPDPMRQPQSQGSVGNIGGWAGDGGETVANAINSGPRGEQQRGTLLRDRDGQEAHGPVGKLCGSRVSPAPPGPSDADGWAGVLHHFPFLAPSLRQSEAEHIFRRVVDGMEYEPHMHPLRSLFCENRTDRLRMLGNGVYPDSAAVAFITLMGKMFKEGST